MSLANRLKREMKANPAKAAGLGVSLLVACYFWAPLIKGFVAPEDATPAPAPASSGSAPAPGAVVPAVATATPATPAATASGDSAAYEWQKHAKSMDTDRRMFGCAELPSERDPFKTPQTKIERQAAIEAAAAPEKVDAPREITPRDAGLILSGTIVSPRKKVAEIGGQSYRLGARVKAGTDEFKATFRLVEIHARGVILERNGKRYTLKLPRPSLTEQAAANRDDDEDNAFADDQADEAEMIAEQEPHDDGAVVQAQAGETVEQQKTGGMTQ